MNIAARPNAAGRVPQDRERPGIADAARIAMFDDLDAAEPAWRRLEATGPFATPYQRFEWIRHWFDALGTATGYAPLVVVGCDRDGAPQFVLPLASVRRNGCHVVRFCGGSHSNLNMPIWRGEFPCVSALLSEIAARRQVDLFAFLGQPETWQGKRNPFATLPRQRSPDDVCNGSLDPDGPPFRPRLPSGMRKKERRLLRLDGFRYAMIDTAVEAERAIAVFRSQKAARFARQGIRNIFADAHLSAFIRAACIDGIAEGRPAIELHTLTGAGETLAIVGGVSNAQRFSVMFNSITDSVLARLSPGIILMSHIIAECARRGITSFDLGAGDAPYKHFFSTGSERRFDSFIPFSARGRLLAAAYGGSGTVRRLLKSSPVLMNALHAARRLATFRSLPMA